VRADVAVVHLQLTGEDVGVRLVADGDEHAFQCDVLLFAAAHVLDAHAGHAAGVAEHFVERTVQLQDDLAFLRFFHQVVDHDAFGAEGVAAVHQRDAVGDVGQIQGFFHGGVAAADHRDVLAAVEEPVAGRAAGHTAPHEGFLGRQAEILRRGTGTDDQRVAAVAARIAGQQERFLLQFGGVDVIEDDLRVETLGMLLEALHQFRALHAVRVGRPVVHLGGGHQLPALRHAGDQHRIEVGACGIHGGGVSGGTGAEDDEGVMLDRGVHGKILSVVITGH